MYEKINEGEKGWVEKDNEAWEKAAEQAESDGYERQPDQYRGATFCKNDKVFALVRNLGKLNWHLEELEGVND